MKTVWLKRSEEWIKANPGKGTMYKEEIDLVKSVPKELTKEAKKVYTKRIEKGLDSGVYVITCEPTKTVYVGQSVNMGTRMRSHKMYITQSAMTNIATYDQMIDDCNTHGIDSFTFVKYMKISNGSTKDMLYHESLTMAEFLSKGYKLYNKAISCYNVHCPDEYKELINRLIEALKQKQSFENRLNILLDGKE